MKNCLSYSKIKIFLILPLIIFFSAFYGNKINGNHIFKKQSLKIFEREDSMKLELTKDLLTIYSELYDYTRNGYTKPKFSNQIKDFSTNKTKLNICICSIGKNENLYIREFLEYYILLGIDKIFIYDNNDIEGESFEDVLEDYIKNKNVEIIDVRGLSSVQIPIYNYCYRKNNNFYDWIGFLDFDEFLYIKNNLSINQYFQDENFNKCQTIYFNWVMYSDNDLIKFENRKCVERFTYPSLNFKQGKSFVRGKIKNLMISTTHIPGINIFNFCNSNGELIYPKNFFGNKFEISPKAFIKHFYTKTAEEFCNKIKRGHAHFHKKHPKYLRSIKSRLSMFFRINKITKEKINILEKCIGLKLNIKHKIL